MPLPLMLVRAFTFCAPPAAWMYLAKTWSGVGALGACLKTSTSLASSGGALYWMVRFGTPFAGPASPRWQVQHVATGLPAKFVLLMVLTMMVIRRSVRLIGVA